MNLIAWLMVGVIAGLVAKALMPAEDPGGLIVTILLGIAGGIIGGFLSIALGLGDGMSSFDLGTVLLALFGSLLLLVAYRLINDNKGLRT